MSASPGMLQNAGYTRGALGGSGAVIAMKVLWFGNLINIILNPCLIFGWGPFPEMGITGAAVGTVVGRIRLTPAALRFDRTLMGHILKPATSGMFQIFVATASWTALIRIASTFGAEVLAGYTIAIRVVIFSILPSWGLCNTAATLVGQNLGAGKPDRAEASVWAAARYNCYFLGSLSLGFLLFAEPILGIFTHEPNVVAIGAECLRFVSGAYVFLACYWLLQIPLAWTLAIGLGFGPRGVFSAVTAAETAVAIVAVLVFRRGTWKLQKI